MSDVWSTPVKEYVQEHIESLESGNLFEFFGNATDMLDCYYRELVALTDSIGIDSKEVRKRLLFDRITYQYLRHPELRKDDDILYKSMCHMGLTVAEFQEVVSKAKVHRYA